MSFGGYINGVGDLADAQGDVNAGAFGGIHDDHLLDALEAFAFDGQTVSPGAEKRELIRAIPVRCRAELGGVFLIDGGDGGADDDGACRIFYYSGYAACCFLSGEGTEAQNDPYSEAGGDSHGC